MIVTDDCRVGGDIHLREHSVAERTGAGLRFVNGGDKTVVEVKHLRRVVKAKPQDATAAPVPPLTQDMPKKEPSLDIGLVSLLVGMKFDQDNDMSMKCPSCGEEVAVDKGQCPECHEIVRAKDPYALEARVLPLIDVRNVVYVHLDVEAGDVKYVQRTAEAKTELQEIHLEDATSMVSHFPMET